jgi:SAM-dependent methyltransferase
MRDDKLVFWDRRYQEQARWTEQIRRSLSPVFGLRRGDALLEVGSGTGVVLADMAMRTGASPFGVDIDAAACAFAAASVPGSVFAAADGARLPFPDSAFGASFCHYLLLWVQDPLALLLEMLRVTRAGGRVACLAEPDYGGRIDYPESLSSIGQLQTQSLGRQGANPFIGRQVRSLLHRAGLADVEVGVLGGEWRQASAPSAPVLEWETLRSDLRDLASEEQLASAQEADRLARLDGSRILFVPTFYGLGRVPS